MSDPTVTDGPAGAGDPDGRRGYEPEDALVAAAGVPHLEPPKPDPGPGQRAFVERGDRVFKTLAVGSGAFVVILVAAIGLFLLVQAIPPLLDNQANFLTSRQFEASDPNNLRFGILDLLLVTVEVSLFALILAMPVGLAIAVFLTQYAPERLSRPMSYAIDVLAAVPSIVYGLWGLFVLAPVIQPFSQWLQDQLGWVFFFSPGNGRAGATLFTAGIVLAVMILPIITAITREVFAQTPRSHIEGALALGATRWEVVKTTVWPFGKAGYVSASMLGLGRALGETIALTIILSAVTSGFSGSLFDGGATFASKIALAANEFNDPTLTGAYIAAGLVLFVLTFVVNALARAAISRGAKAT